jgi:hypothetical protein
MPLWHLDRAIATTMGGHTRGFQQAAPGPVGRVARAATTVTAARPFQCLATGSTR